MVNKKDFLKNKLKQIIPAEQLFLTDNKSEIKKQTQHKNLKKKENLSRVNLLMPSDLKNKAEILARDYKGAGNLSKLIIEQIKRYVKENETILKIIMDK